MTGPHEDIVAECHTDLMLRAQSMIGEKLSIVAPGRGDLAQRLGVPLAYLVGLGLLVGLIAGGHLEWLAVLLAGGFAVALAYRFPVLSIGALVAFGILPLMFLTTPWQAISTASFGHVPIESLSLLPMAGAVALRVTVLAATRRRVALPRYVPLVIALASVLVAVMVVGVAAGFTVRPLSAIREFTVSYLGLVIVPYVALFLHSRRDIVRVFKGVAVVGVCVPFLLLPLVGQLKGWGIGPQARFYAAPVHMGILLGLITIYVLQARELAWRHVFGIVLLPCVVLIMVDSHRSVWLAAGVSVIVLIASGRIRLERFWKWGIVAVLVIVLTGTALAAMGKDPVGYVASRGAAFRDPSADVTSSWRLAVWRSALEQGRQHPVLGEGFGAYFDFRLANGGRVTVEPHSLYVQLFLKLGLFGLVAYLGAAAALLAALAGAWTRTRRSGDANLEPIILMGLLAGCASLAFGLVYNLEVFAMLFVGLGLAAALRSTDSSAGL